MSKDDESDRRRQVPWLGIASLLVTVRPGSFEFPAIHFPRPQ